MLMIVMNVAPGQDPLLGTAETAASKNQTNRRGRVYIDHIIVSLQLDDYI